MAESPCGRSTPDHVTFSPLMVMVNRGADMGTMGGTGVAYVVAVGTCRGTGGRDQNGC